MVYDVYGYAWELFLSTVNAVQCSWRWGHGSLRDGEFRWLHGATELWKHCMKAHRAKCYHLELCWHLHWRIKWRGDLVWGLVPHLTPLTILQEWTYGKRQWMPHTEKSLKKWGLQEMHKMGKEVIREMINASEVENEETFETGSKRNWVMTKW